MWTTIRSKCIFQKKRQNRGLYKQEERVHLPNIYAISWTWSSCSLGLIWNCQSCFCKFCILMPCGVQYWYIILRLNLSYKQISTKFVFHSRKDFNSTKTSRDCKTFSQWILNSRKPYTHILKEKFRPDLQLPLHRLLWLALLCFGHLCIGHIYHKNTRFDYVMNYLRNDYTRNDWWRTFGIEEKSLSGNFASGKCIPCADLWNDHKDDN